MQVARNWAAAVCFCDQFKRHRQPAGMVPVTMREDRGVNAAKFNAQSSAIVFDREIHWTSVEKNCVALGAAERSDDERQSMIRTTLAFHIGRASCRRTD